MLYTYSYINCEYAHIIFFSLLEVSSRGNAPLPFNTSVYIPQVSQYSLS